MIYMYLTYVPIPAPNKVSSDWYELSPYPPKYGCHRKPIGADDEGGDGPQVLQDGAIA